MGKALKEEQKRESGKVVSLPRRERAGTERP
jgi:hypothetical protein